MMGRVLATRLKESRLKKGLSQEELGKLVGLSKAAISQYENGIHVPSIENSHALANVLGVSFNWLIGYSEHRYKIEVEHLTEIYISLNDERKKELYNFAEYLYRKMMSESG